MKKKTMFAAEAVAKEQNFSGTFCIKQNGELLTKSYGFANIPDDRMNEANTRFGIASGSKLFTAIAICQLVEQDKLRFSSRLADCLNRTFPLFDRDITVHQLLTHTSGIPDYFDESVMDDYEELWVKTPMYHIRELSDFLPLFQNRKMKERPGEAFRYNNSGYVLLGLIVEQVSGVPFSDYIQRHVLSKVGMEDSGYFELDALPERTAIGYIEKEDGTWRTNTFSIPAKGGADGGIFVTAPDMMRLWDALLEGRLLSETMLNQLLTDHVVIQDDIHYGYGIYMQIIEGQVCKYMLMGYDPGVNFRMVHHPNFHVTIVVCSNKSNGAFDVLKAIENNLVHTK